MNNHSLFENNGNILSEGKRPVVNLQTHKYSGTGSVKSIQKIEKWYQKWWIQLTFGGLVSLIVTYIAFRFGWN